MVSSSRCYLIPKGLGLFRRIHCFLPTIVLLRSIRPKSVSSNIRGGESIPSWSLFPAYHSPTQICLAQVVFVKLQRILSSSSRTSHSGVFINVHEPPRILGVQIDLNAEELLESRSQLQSFVHIITIVAEGKEV